MRRSWAVRSGPGNEATGTGRAPMTSIGAVLDQPAAPDAEFVKVTTKQIVDKDTRTSTTLGWLVKNDGDSWVVPTPFGHRETFYKEKTIKGRRGEWTTRSSWEKSPIADEVKRVVEPRRGRPGL